MPSGDLTTKLDFSDSKRDRVQVVQNLFALGRQAQAIGFEGPILGKKYSVTREQQLALEAKKDEERRLAAEQTAVYENVRLAISHSFSALYIDPLIRNGGLGGIFLKTRRRNACLQRLRFANHNGCRGVFLIFLRLFASSH